jgi:hypothetical protein
VSEHPTVVDLREIVRTATLATPRTTPNRGRFRLGPDRIDLLADRTRALPAVNAPSDRS